MLNFVQLIHFFSEPKKRKASDEDSTEKKKSKA